MTAAFVLLGVGVVIAVIWLWRRGSNKPSDLGTISETWLAEESASGPRRY